MSAVITSVDQLVSAVYVSSGRRDLKDEDILEILRAARQNNKERNITGMLLYRAGNFLQVLEGPSAAVDELIRKIKRDPRHHGVILMSRRNIQERQFGEWSMAFRDQNNVAAAEEGYSSFLDPTSRELEDEMDEGSQIIYRLLRRFKEGMR